MRNFWNLLPTTGKILAVLVVIMLVILLIVEFVYQPERTPVIRPATQKESVLQKGTPDLPITDVESGLNVINKEASSDGTIAYNLTSKNPIRPDQLITRDGKIIFERIYIPEDPADPGYLILDDVESKHGQAVVENGSNFWGDFMKTYIYADKGLAFIANPHTREVLEMQVFTPMSLEEYKVQYGSDISGKEFNNEGL